MFAKTIIDSDAFLDLQPTAQALYFHLSMRADDDGFVDKPRAIMRLMCANDSDMESLAQNKFIIHFKDEGVVVIKHWKMSNTIKSDRYTETKYKEIKAKLETDENGAYILKSCFHTGDMPETNCLQTGTEKEPQVRLGKYSLDKINEYSAEAAPPVVNPLPIQKPEAKAEKTKEPPLREMEAANDFERVEKVYLQNWDTLYSQHKVNTENPIVNWNQTRKLLKRHFQKIKVDEIIQAINRGLNDDFIMQGGYSLGAMLAASVLNRLINTTQRGASGALPPPSLRDKKSLKGLDSW